jgi:hypothetical protein
MVSSGECTGGTGNCHGTLGVGECAGVGDGDFGGGVACRRSLFLVVKGGGAKDESKREEAWGSLKVMGDGGCGKASPNLALAASMLACCL